MIYKCFFEFIFYRQISNKVFFNQYPSILQSFVCKVSLCFLDIGALLSGVGLCKNNEQWMGCFLCKVCIIVRIKTYTHIYFRILYWFLLHQNNVLNFLHLHLRFWCLILIRLVSTLHSWVQLLYGLKIKWDVRGLLWMKNPNINKI